MLCRTEDPNSTSIGNLEHFLLSGGCPSLADTRLSMLKMIQAYLVPRPYLFPVFLNLWGRDSDSMLQFLLDCSAIPLVIKLAQEMVDLKIYDKLFYITRTYIAVEFHWNSQIKLQKLSPSVEILIPSMFCKIRNLEFQPVDQDHPRE